jgi:hypothetical protein
MAFQECVELCRIDCAIGIERRGAKAIRDVIRKRVEGLLWSYSIDELLNGLATRRPWTEEFRTDRAIEDTEIALCALRFKDFANRALAEYLMPSLGSVRSGG